MSTYLITILNSIKSAKSRSNFDLIDTLHHSLTTNILIVLSLLVSWKQFGSDPIECMVPDNFPKPWEEYVENYCWAQDTYYMPEKELNLDHKAAIKEGQISYYQWVPFYLILSAMSFQIPHLMWKIFSGTLGTINICSLIQHATESENIELAVRMKTINTLSAHLEKAFRFHRRLHRKKITPHRYLRIFNFLYSSCYLTIIYMLSKLAYLGNDMINFVLMNNFLNVDKENQDLCGWAALNAILNGTQWHHSGFFPRVTLCDFKARVMGNIQQYSVQCVLVINIFNEKIFVFLWFWYHILIVLSCLSFAGWAVVCFIPFCRTRFITRHLELSDIPFDRRVNETEVERFVKGYLRVDGVFVIRTIGLNTGVIYTTDIVASLWKRFFRIEEIVKQWQATSTQRLHSSPPKLGDNDSNLKQRKPSAENHLLGRQMSDNEMDGPQELLEENYDENIQLGEQFKDESGLTAFTTEIMRNMILHDDKDAMMKKIKKKENELTKMKHVLAEHVLAESVENERKRIALAIALQVKENGQEKDVVVETEEKSKTKTKKQVKEPAYAN